MKWVELISFTVADVLNPVLYFEAQGFYNINKQVKEQLVKYGSQLGLIGLATNVVRTVYEFYKSFSQMKKIDMAFHSRDIDEQRRSLVDTKRVANQHMQAMQQHLASFDQTVEQLKRGQLGVKAINRYRSVHNRIMGSLGSDTIPNGFSGREDLKDEELTEAKDILPRYQKDTATIIDELRLKIDTCNQKIEELNNLEVGREVSAQYFNQRLFSLIESVLELSSAILMLSSVCIASIPAATIAASLGVLSSSVALIRIWQKSGLSSEDEAQYQEVINWTAQVLMRMQQNQLEEGSGGSNPSASNLTLRREQ
jgi:hypothetical protein